MANSNPSDRGRDASLGLILQRGGEELRLEKVPDRFTTRLTDPTEIAALQALLQPEFIHPIAQGQLVEWGVPEAQLEAKVQQARAHPAVRFASHAYRLQASPQTWIYLTEQITLQFVEELPLSRRQALLEPHGLRELSPLEGIPNAAIFEVIPGASENPIKIANRLMALPEVLVAEPNVVVATAALYRPSDALYAQQWHLTPTSGSDVKADAHISVESAWDLTRGTRSIVIALTDDGFDLAHPDLQGLGKIVAPQDLKVQDAVPLPEETTDNHGTACAGLAIGEENRSGIVGVAPGCGFMPIRMTGFLDDASIERLFNEAIDQGAAVISCSWSPAAVYFPLSLRQRNALTRAATQGRRGKGCVIVFSAGNANRPVSGTLQERNWPQNALSGSTQWLSGFAIHPDVIAVSACTSLSRKAAYSNWGTHIAVAAPSNNAPPNMALPKVGTVSTGPPINQRLTGRGMVTSDRTGEAGYDRDAYTNTFGGTSSACPIVAGVAGLVLSANPDLTAREVKQILQATADKILDPDPDPQLGLRHGTYDHNGHSLWFGYGRVNAHKAVLEARRRAGQGRTYQRAVELVDVATVAIPDNSPAGMTRTLQGQDRGTVQDLQVQVAIAHPFLSDLTLTLRTPSGRSLLLQGRTLGNQPRLATTYTLRTTPALRWAIGEAATGQWQLQVIDHAPGHVGELQEWKLVIALSEG